MDSITIRTFQPDDRSLVEAFFDQMGGETRALFDRGSGNRRWALRFFDGEDSEHIVRWMALDQGQMVGYVFLWDTNQGVPWLGIAVADTYKGQGLGGRLMDTAHEYARSHGKGGVMLTTHVANLRGQSLYERCGYQRLGMHTSGEILYLLRFSQT